MHRSVIIVQARMQASRFPGKVLQTVAGRTLLDRQLARLRRCRSIDEICIATTDGGDDEPIADLGNRSGVACYRGPSDDVLSRYVGAARLTRAEIVVRITADCPLIEPQLIDRVVHELVEHAATCDYASNVLDRTYPRGLDAEAFFLDTLLRMDRIARSSSSREHVTLAVRSERPELFLTRSIRDDENNSDLRWTVDVPADLDLIRRLHEELDLDSPTIGYRDIVRYVRAHPELTLMNAAAKTWDPIDSQSASIYEGAP